MSNTTSQCPVPFLPSSDYGDGGYLAGRFCGENPLAPGTYCCLPCPAEQWIYSDEFLNDIEIPQWLSIISIVPLAFLLLSWIIFDPDKTHRHYLSVGLVISLVIVQLAFIIPIAADPDKCYDAITPKDMHNSLACAWSGACLQAGGIATTVWIVLRAFWFNIRVCWDRSPGNTFKWICLIIGSLVPLVCLVAAVTVVGYSYRLGNTCVVNSDHSFVVFWGWLLAFAGLAFFVQCVTTGYAAGVYLKIMAKETIRRRKTNTGSNSSGEAKVTNPSSEEAGPPLRNLTEMPHIINFNSLRWRKLRTLFVLQWRQILISILVVVESAFFVIVFWDVNLKLSNINKYPNLQQEVLVWSVCLTVNNGDKTPCLGLADSFVGKPKLTMASYVMASLIGLEAALILVRRSLLEEWLTLFKRVLSCGRHRRSLPLNEPGGYDGRHFDGASSEKRRHIPTLGDALGGSHFMGSSNRHDRHPYVIGWTRALRAPSPAKMGRDMAGGEDWGWQKRKDTLASDGLDGEDDTQEAGLEGFRAPPGALGGIPRTLVRNTSTRPGSLRLETREEALARLEKLDAGIRDSVVLGDDHNANESGDNEQSDNPSGDHNSHEVVASSFSWLSGGSSEADAPALTAGHVRAFETLHSGHGQEGNVAPEAVGEQSEAAPLPEPRVDSEAEPRNGGGTPH